MTANPKKLFNTHAFMMFIIILITEIFIAIYVRDAFIRPYGGDILAILLVYYGFKSIIRASDNLLILMALSTGFCVEFAQYFNAAHLLGLEKYKIARIIIGESFSIEDLGCYCIGATICYCLNQLSHKMSAKN